MRTAALPWLVAPSAPSEGQRAAYSEHSDKPGRSVSGAAQCPTWSCGQVAATKAWPYSVPIVMVRIGQTVYRTVRTTHSVLLVCWRTHTYAMPIRQSFAEPVLARQHLRALGQCRAVTSHDKPRGLTYVHDRGNHPLLCAPCYLAYAHRMIDVVCTGLQVCNPVTQGTCKTQTLRELCRVSIGRSGRRRYVDECVPWRNDSHVSNQR